MSGVGGTNPYSYSATVGGASSPSPEQLRMMEMQMKMMQMQLEISANEKVKALAALKLQEDGKKESDRNTQRYVLRQRLEEIDRVQARLSSESTRNGQRQKWLRNDSINLYPTLTSKQYAAEICPLMDEADFTAIRFSLLTSYFALYPEASA